MRELEARLNLRHMELEKALKYLSVEMPAPITKLGTRWNATAAARSYRIDAGRVEAITAIRRREQAEMDAYMTHRGCLMEFLARALDDPNARPCGRCTGCERTPLLDPGCDPDLGNRAAMFLRRSFQPLQMRKLWPSGDALPEYGFTGRIGEDLQGREGRALCLWRDAGWGQMVAAGKRDGERFCDELVAACAGMVREWAPDPAPEWVACIPSLQRPDLVPDFARRLAESLGLAFHPCLRKVKPNRPQKEMENSFQQARNLDGVFAVDEALVQREPCLLVDDVVDSKWTFTVAAALLRQAGCAAVVPVALALNSLGAD